MRDDCVIYDFETLSQNPDDGVAVSLGALKYSESRFIDNPYGYLELIECAKYIKFDVAEQVRIFSRKISPDTLNWWKKQGTVAQQALAPSDKDVSIQFLPEFLKAVVEEQPFGDFNKIFTRGNTFDPMFLRSLLRHSDMEDPFNWWALRDTRSFIDGLAYGEGISNKFIPEGLDKLFIDHDPRHDIAMDVMRMQMLVRAISGVGANDIPF